jgi:hypothetical protein
MTGLPDSPRLLFAWERAHRFRWALFGFVALSIDVHAATFFLFQITYPQRATIPPPAPEVSLLLPTTPENRSLLRRIEAEDPALVAAATSITPPGLTDVKYRASYETVRTQPRIIDEEPVTVQFPPPKDPLAIIRSSSPGGQPAGAAPPPQPTRVRFSAALAGRAPHDATGWTFPARATELLEEAIFLIGVSDRGEVRYVFLQRSSRESSARTQEWAAFDRLAAAQLSRLEFQRSETPIAWGMATVAWGDDAYTANPQSAVRSP